MYYYLRGTIVEVYPEFCVIDVNGVGYEFLCINPSDFTLFEQTKVYTQHIVKEDDELFVGFKTLREKDIFNRLISVKGIGPKTAVNALRGTTIDKFCDMINNDDLKNLKKLPGIGPKAAAQIILDLKGKIKSSTINNVINQVNNVTLNKEQEDAKVVLKSLGFKTKDIEDVLSKLPEVLSASDLVNEALKRLGK